MLADESEGPTLAAMVAANASLFETWQTLHLDAIESVTIPDVEADTRRRSRS
jgi:hypothetical protein